MNKLQLIGRPTADPEISYYTSKRGNTESQSARAKFTVAVNRRERGENTADFIPCVAFGKTAEVIEKYVKKGGQIYLEGSLQNNNYENKEGNKVYGFQMHVSQIELLGKKSTEEDQETGGFVNMSEQEETPFG